MFFSDCSFQSQWSEHALQRTRRQTHEPILAAGNEIRTWTTTANAHGAPCALWSWRSTPSGSNEDTAHAATTPTTPGPTGTVKFRKRGQGSEQAFWNDSFRHRQIQSYIFSRHLHVLPADVLDHLQSSKWWCCRRSGLLKSLITILVWLVLIWDATWLQSNAKHPIFGTPNKIRHKFFNYPQTLHFPAYLWGCSQLKRIKSCVWQTPV